MRPLRVPRNCFFVLAAMAATAACQTDGTLSSGSSSPVTTTATISQAVYLPFYDQGDHLASLVQESRFKDAARLYDEQREYFRQPEAAAKHAALLRRTADHFNAASEPDLVKASESLASAWPVAQAEWPAVRGRLAEGARALATYPDHELLKNPAFRSEAVKRLESALAQLREQLNASAPEAFLAFDHFSGGSFFDAYPIELDKLNFTARYFNALKNRLDQSSSSALRVFAQNYPRDVLGDEHWHELGALFTGKILNETSRGGRPDLKATLQAVRAAKAAGFDVKAVPGTRIAFVEITSHALLKSGGVEFPVEVDVDLPIDVSRASLDKALSESGSSKGDYVVAFDVALAKASRRITDTKKNPSQKIVGQQKEPNPAYEAAKMKVLQAQNEYNAIQIRQSVQSGRPGYYSSPGAAIFGGILQGLGDAMALAPAKEKLEQAMREMQTTPQYIDKPIFEPYQFDKATVRGTKTMTVHYYVIDRSRRTFFKSTFDIVERRTFEPIYNVHDNDPAKESHYSGGHRDEDVKSWEEASATVRLSQLVDHYLAHKGQEKPLPELAALRQEMLADKNRAIAKHEAARFDARPLNDTRFDNVVVVYVGAKKSLGTGFFVASDVVLTNWHVVEDKPFVEMKMYDKQETFGKVIAKDVRLDLALVKVQSRGRPVRFYTDKSIDLGKTVEAIGHPQRLEFSITRGVVSAIRRHPSINLSGGGGKEVLYIQTDAPINPGNSGGPLFLGDRVVGVNTWGLRKDTAEGLNFSVHYSEVLEFLREHLPGFQAKSEERKADP